MIKFLAVLGLILLVVFFWPSRYRSKVYDESCDSLCKTPTNSSLNGSNKLLICGPALDGLWAACLGINVKRDCEDALACHAWCNNDCYGLVVGPREDPNPLKAKLIFFQSQPNKFGLE